MTEDETDRLFDATVRRMLTTPPKPHEDMKLGKPRRAGKGIQNEQGNVEKDRPIPRGDMDRRST